tara:strand:+ start:458 stop:943 length:486 start_codon:yes stop_codon:yes gene_type:complete
MSIGFSIGGFDVKGWMMAVAVPVLSAVSGVVYFGYDTLTRFMDTEEYAQNATQSVKALNVKLGESVDTLETADVEINSRIQALEQAIADNDVRGLSEKLATLSTSMQQLLEQQRVLLDLRSDVDRAITITNGIGDKLDTYDTEINDIWTAYDSLVDNPLGN